QHRCESENDSFVALRQLFLVGCAGPLVAETGRQVFGGDLLHHVHRASRADAASRSTQNLNGAESIVAIDAIRTGAGLYGSNRTERHHAAVGAPNIKTID